MACGFEFKVAVGDRSLKRELDNKFEGLVQDKKMPKAPVVEYKVACDRTISP